MIMLGFAIVLTLMLLAVCYFDITRFIIPNELNLGFILLFPAFVFLSPVHIEWWWSLAVFGGFFAFGLLLFMSNVIGGGDIKLLIALSIWIGWHPFTLIALIKFTALSGGIIAVFLIVARRMFKNMKNQQKLPKVLRAKEPMPYGLAIVYAFGYLIWTNQIYGLQVPEL